jgi:ribosome maturation factor RimP
MRDPRNEPGRKGSRAHAGDRQAAAATGLLEEQVRSLAEAAAGRNGAEIVEVSVRRGRTQLVRVVVDRPGGIDLETCARVSEGLSRLLDADDTIAGSYTLEVTSPGLNRPLRTVQDFRRALGRNVRIVLAMGQHEGTLEEVGEDRVVVATGSERVNVPIADIAKAKVVLPW